MAKTKSAAKLIAELEDALSRIIAAESGNLEEFQHKDVLSIAQNALLKARCGCLQRHPGHVAECPKSGQRG